MYTSLELALINNLKNTISFAELFFLQKNKYPKRKAKELNKNIPYKKMIIQ